MKRQKLVLGISAIVFLPFFLVTGPAHNGTYSGDFPPTRDFGFLHRFICISDLFGKDQWHNNKGRSFDPQGVHLTNNKKHPVNACHYALFCYDEYVRTGDTSMLSGFKNQVRYLMDPTSYNYVDSDMVAYPYDIVFHDLKPVWYSALAQSEAICVLIRFYSITRDEAALDLLIKLHNFMISPQEYGCGTMSVTPEGHRWYEEYPNSRQERQVLNGFLLSVVALYEYSKLFPADDSAKVRYRDAIETVKQSFQFYDTGTWLKYNRGDGRLVSNGYMKWQTLETKLLYEVTGDIYFKNLNMLLATYCYDKPFETPGSKLKDYDFSVPLDTVFGKKLDVKKKTVKFNLSLQTASFETSFSSVDAEMAKTYDNNINSFGKFTIGAPQRKSENHFTVKFNKAQQLSGSSITFALQEGQKMPSLTMYYKIAGNNRWIKAPSQENWIDNRTVWFSFKQIVTSSVAFVFNSVDGYDELRVADLAVYLPPVEIRSDYLHFQTPVVVSNGAVVTINPECSGMDDVAIFSKSAASAALLKNERWNPLDVMHNKSLRVESNFGRAHQFLVVYQPGKGKREIQLPVIKN